MALWGNDDSKTATGTANISSNGFVNGTSTVFQSEAKVGDFITMANNDYLIISITSNTAAQVIGRYGNTSVPAVANAAYILSEKPKYTLWDATSDGGSNNVYGVDTTEINVVNGAVREVVFTSRGSGYSSNATLTVSGGAGSTTAASGNAQSNSSGRITAIRFTNNGIGYTLPPTLTVSAPSAVVFNGNVDVSGSLITTASAPFFAAGDTVVYAGNTLSTPSPLIDTATYFISFANSTVIALAATPGGANIALTKAAGSSSTANGATIRGETATVAAVLSGTRSHAHAGWVRRTVGTGGRAGRVQEETLVAMGSIAGDAEDNVFPDA